jgi:energy-coupling factor transport system substrate-specific component
MASIVGGPTSTAAADTRWRTRDIVVAAVIGVAFGVAFVVVGGLWKALEFLGPLQNLFYGVWLLPAVVAPLIIRKPGAALFAEMVAAGLSAILGSAWGVDTLLSGFVQGAAAELVFAFTLYRSWNFAVLALAGLASASAAYVHDVVVWYQGYATDVLVIIAISMAISGLVVVPVLSVALVRAMRSTGVLDGFPG